MAHGGKRAGAGRKETLDMLGRIHVGARAENFRDKITRRKAMARLDEKLRNCGVRDAQARSLSILRREGLHGWQNSYEGEEAREDLGFSLLTYHGLSDPDNPDQEPEPEDAPRGIHLEWTAYATREHVLRVVARWASWYYQVNITPRRVRDYWRDYRSFLQES